MILIRVWAIVLAYGTKFACHLTVRWQVCRAFYHEKGDETSFATLRVEDFQKTIRLWVSGHFT